MRSASFSGETHGMGNLPALSGVATGGMAGVVVIAVLSFYLLNESQSFFDLIISRGAPLPGDRRGSRLWFGLCGRSLETEEGAMKLGFFGINMGPCADAGVALRVARAAEAAGLESVWTGEHVVLPDPQAPPSPLPPEAPLLDPAVALAFVAAGTERIRLGTGIIILPQRNPMVLAKELASVDVVSRGRLIFGLGIGYLKAEFDALGIPFTDKGPRSIEYLEAMLAIWTQTASGVPRAGSFPSKEFRRSRARCNGLIRRSSSAGRRRRHSAGR